MTNSFSISAGGRRRLWAAIYDEVRREFAGELAAVNGYWARAAVEKKILAEVKRRMKELASPESLWNAS